jgi:plastocyanin domain-containing protein
MAEQVFFERGDIKVTSARVVFGSQTFTLSGVTSVRSLEVKPNRKGPIVLMIVGLFCTAGLGTIAGIIWWFLQKTEYAVMFASASGETQAYTNQDPKIVAEIVNAINDAIVHRG